MKGTTIDTGDSCNSKLQTCKNFFSLILLESYLRQLGAGPIGGTGRLKLHHLPGPCLFALFREDFQPIQSCCQTAILVNKFLS